MRKLLVFQKQYASGPGKINIAKNRNKKLLRELVILYLSVVTLSK
jgi:hypothetical protein